MWETLGEKPHELISPEIHEEDAELFDLYLDLRAAGGVSYTEIESFMRLTGTDLDPTEIEKLRRIDQIIRECVKNEENKRGQSNTDN